MNPNLGAGLPADRPVRGAVSDDGTRFYESDAWGWRPLWLHRDAVLEVSRSRFGIAAFAAELLAGGYLNQNWRLHCNDHDRVLRVGRPERTLEQVEYEYALTSAWAGEIDQIVVAEGPPGPVVDGHLMTLFPYCDGISGTDIDAPVRVSELAPVMAAMHRISLGLNLEQRPGSGGLDQVDVRDRWTVVRAAIVDRFGNGLDVMAPAGYLDRVVDELTADLDRWIAAGRLRIRAAVHADLNMRNQLYRDGRLVGIIDADDCRVEPLIGEVAGLAYTDPGVDPAAVWQLYRRAGGPLPNDDEELLLPFARLGALGELAWFTDDDGVATHLALAKLHTLAEELSGGPGRG